MPNNSAESSPCSLLRASCSEGQENRLARCRLITVRHLTMKCPYCSEEILENAIVCKHCRRDFQLFIPVLSRLDALEKEAASVRAVLDELSNQRHFNPTPLPAATSRRLLVISLLVVIIASVGSIASYWVAGKFAWAPWAPLLFVSITFPAFGGFAGGSSFAGGI